MLKVLAGAATAFFVAASPLAYAKPPLVRHQNG